MVAFIHVFAMPYCPIDSIHPPWIWGTMYAAFFLVFFFLFFSPYVATILSATMAIPFQFTGIYLWRYLFIPFAPRSSTYAMDTWNHALPFFFRRKVMDIHNYTLHIPQYNSRARARRYACPPAQRDSQPVTIEVDSRTLSHVVPAYIVLANIQLLYRKATSRVNGGGDDQEDRTHIHPPSLSPQTGRGLLGSHARAQSARVYIYTEVEQGCARSYD